MGARLSRSNGSSSRSSTSQRSAAVDRKDDHIMKQLRMSKLSLEPIRLLFTSRIQRHVSKKVSCAGHRRLQIRGKVEKYPFWLSTQYLQQQHGDVINGSIQYLSMMPDYSMAACPPRVPNYLHCHLNKTIKLRVKNRGSSVSAHSRDLYPEIDVISKAISKVLFMISISEDTSKPIALDLKVYEQHRTNKRQQPLLKLREMKVEQVVFDDDNNMAMIGKDFALILFQPGSDAPVPPRSIEGSADCGSIEGLYIRLLDTDPHIDVKFDFADSVYAKRLQLPSYVTNSEDYMKLVLQKAPGRGFHIRHSKFKY